MSLFSPIADAIQRLDKRGHLASARLELSHVDGRWVAQIMADPLPKSIVGAGEIPETAIARLAEEIDKIDWRRIRR